MGIGLLGLSSMLFESGEVNIDSNNMDDNPNNPRAFSSSQTNANVSSDKGDVQVTCVFHDNSEDHHLCNSQ